MITMKDFLESINYQITGGSDYGWSCFGPNARYLDSTDSEYSNGTYNAHAIFDSETQHIYSVEVWDYENHREYRWIDPDYLDQFNAECHSRSIDKTESLDGSKFIDLEVPEDILEKISAIVAGEIYDDRIKVPVDFTDDELFEYMKLAHERDITFNQLVEEALRHAIDAYDRDPESMKEKAKQWKAVHVTNTDNPIDFPVSKNGPAAMTAKKKKKDKK
jgi:hypothetical protein